MSPATRTGQGDSVHEVPDIAGLIWASLGLSVALLVALVVSFLVAGANPATIKPEVQLALVMVLGVSVLMNLLFIMAAAYQRMKLAASDQALGLPSGTIRALIALILILLFTIIGVFLFNTINSTATVSKDALGLAQQLMTTVATLVVAVAGFYFGTASTARGAKLATDALEASRSGSRLEITTESPLRPGTLGEQYSSQFVAEGGRQPYKWTLISGGPAELKLNASSGMLEGTPTVAGAYKLTVQVTDHGNANDVEEFELVVGGAAPHRAVAATQPLTITTGSPLPGGVSNQTYPGATLEASGGTPPYTWTLASGALPNGLELETSGHISGRPSAPGGPFTVQVEDVAHASGSAQFDLPIS